MLHKLNLLYDATCMISMEIHPEKSQYINVNSLDTAPFHIGELEIKHTRSYIYLGTPISNKPLKQQMHDHLSDKPKREEIHLLSQQKQ